MSVSIGFSDALIRELADFPINRYLMADTADTDIRSDMLIFIKNIKN